jgi:predicted GNAT family N-acyltransferase
MIFQKIDFASDLFDEALKMRYVVLREPLGLDYSSEDIAAEADNDHFVLLNSNVIVAYCQMKDLGSGFVKMRQVAVAPDQQSKSLGSKLMTYVEAWAKIENYNTIELHARQTAVDFYLKAGYTIDKEPFEEVGIPHRYMFKHL